VLDRKGRDRKIVALENRAWLGRDQADRHWRRAAQPPEQQVVDAIQCPLAGIDLHLVERFPAGQGREQAGQPQDVVEMAVGDQDALQPFEAHPRLQDLPLGALSAIHQEAVFIVLDQLR
jgi:hypothetical protein